MNLYLESHSLPEDTHLWSALAPADASNFPRWEELVGGASNIFT